MRRRIGSAGPSEQGPARGKSVLPLALGALGMVFGDIGTSPLYAVNELFFGRRPLGAAPATVLGGIGLVVWVLTAVVGVKYILLVLRADNDGEGGVFALFSLLGRHPGRTVALTTTALLFAAGLLYGEGIITPAISVLAAVEGLGLVTSAFEPAIVPVTLALLTALFALQRFGTARMGRWFGPVGLAWFLAIGTLGAAWVLRRPEVLAAFDPRHALRFLQALGPREALESLAAVTLVVTGSEALYADLGHFGRRPIRLSWWAVVYPALILCYLGQGAFLLSGEPVRGGSLFFSLVPRPLVLPMVLLATAATIVASQALISGAFSLSTQAVALDLLPLLRVVHTSEDQRGQIYVPAVNRALYLGAVGLVLAFGSSMRLAAAYGLAVTGVMLTTTLGMAVLAIRAWGWSRKRAVLVFGILLLVDLALLSSNLLKLLRGGWVPLLVALVVFAIVRTWRWGRAAIHSRLAAMPVMTVRELGHLKARPNGLMPRAIVIMAPQGVSSLDDPVPALCQIFWERYRQIPHHLIFLTVEQLHEPFVHEERYRVTPLIADPHLGTVTAVRLRFGFMEEPDVESTLEGIAAHHAIQIDDHPEHWLIHVAAERLLPAPTLGRLGRLRLAAFKFLRRNSDTSDHWFGLGRDVPLTVQVFPLWVA